MSQKCDMTSNNPGSASFTANLKVCEWESFLHRKPLALDRAQAEASLGGKRILITGAGGWIGSALTRTIVGFAPKHLVLLDAAERSLFEIGTALQQVPHPIEHTTILGSVSHPVLLGEIFRRFRPQIVYHAAAFKHVPLMEQNPFAAIENNALGTSLLAQAATNHETEQLILLSTDKAVDPLSIMGASKRIAELTLLSRCTTATRMKAIRLGNVLGSEGSIVPLFLKQIMSGQPVTVTHPEVRRYFLTTEDAITLLLLAPSAETSRGILVPELGEPVLVEALARHLIAKAHGSSTGQVPIVFTQLRPGDKMCEALVSARESYVAHADSRKLLRDVDTPGLPSTVLGEILQQLQRACQERSLERLLAAVMRAVPEYRPSAVIREAIVGNEAGGLTA
jgi:FlaA1/EpsC-like NDP-sugar epimerase